MCDADLRLLADDDLQVVLLRVGKQGLDDLLPLRFQLLLVLL